MEELIELLRQIQELAGVGIEALQGAAEGTKEEAPADGAPAEEPPAENGPPQGER